jgi:hypothetical protein
MTPRNRLKDVLIDKSVYKEIQKDDNIADFVTYFLNNYLIKLPENYQLRILMSEDQHINFVVYPKGESENKYSIVCYWSKRENISRWNTDNVILQ